MLDSTVLDVAIGLIFTFLAFSLAVSAIVEAIASFFKLRSANLLKGVQDLLNDPDFKGLALHLYNHALINPREPGTAGVAPQLPAAAAAPPPASTSATGSKAVKMGSQLPAYINPNQFAAAMVDILKFADRNANGSKKTVQGLKDEIAKIDNPQLRQLLNGIVDRTDGDLQKVQTELAGWFDNAMDRVGGAYKRKTQLWAFITALILALVLNVSAINIGEALWGRPMIAKAIAAKVDLSDVKAKEAVANLDALEALDVPIGWKAGDMVKLFPGHMALWPYGWPAPLLFFNLIAGWLITAIATLFGAPFWFDSLQRIVRLKGSGPSPAEKKSDTAAAG